MDKEVVNRMIAEVASGNQDMKWLLEEIYREGKSLIDPVPNSEAGMVARRMIHTASCLAQRRISPMDLINQGSQYWETKEGKVTADRLKSFVETRKLAANTVQDGRQTVRANI